MTHVLAMDTIKYNFKNLTTAILKEIKNVIIKNNTTYNTNIVESWFNKVNQRDKAYISIKNHTNNKILKNKFEKLKEEVKIHQIKKYTWQKCLKTQSKCK